MYEDRRFDPGHCSTAPISSKKGISGGVLTAEKYQGFEKCDSTFSARFILFYLGCTAAAARDPAAGLAAALRGVQEPDFEGSRNPRCGPKHSQNDLQEVQHRGRIAS